MRLTQFLMRAKISPRKKGVCTPLDHFLWTVLVVSFSSTIIIVRSLKKPSFFLHTNLGLQKKHFDGALHN